MAKRLKSTAFYDRLNNNLFYTYAFLGNVLFAAVA